MATEPDNSRNPGTPQRVLDAIPNYLGALAILAYPVGFGVLWLQLFANFVADPLTALYVAALVPVPVVIASGFATTLFLMLITTGPALTFSVAFLQRESAAVYRGLLSVQQDQDMSNEDRALLRFSKILPLMLFIAGILVAVNLPLVFGFVWIDSWSDVFLYIGYLLCIVTAGLIAGYAQSRVLARRYAETGVHETEGGLRDHLRSLFAKPVMGISIGAFFGALFLAPLQVLSLPTADLQLRSEDEVSLLSHFDQTWYVFDNDGRLLAIPDDEAGVVQISSERE